ncbi:MAG TPA: DoxX family protein [Usitatibacter sp.]|nr:DoxX family protein [Usitatibacter sp.]
MKTGIHAETAADFGTLTLRLSVGILILLHGIAKLRYGLGDVATSLARANLPAPIGYLVYVGEVLAPSLMIVGLWTRPAALLLATNMFVALVIGHPHELFVTTDHGGLFLEVQWLYFAGALAVALLGGGRFGIGGLPGAAPVLRRWN